MGDPAKVAREIRGGHAHQVKIQNLVNATQEKFVDPARCCLSGGNVLKDSESAVEKSVPVHVCLACRQTTLSTMQRQSIELNLEPGRLQGQGRRHAGFGWLC